ALLKDKFSVFIRFVDTFLPQINAVKGFSSRTIFVGKYITYLLRQLNINNEFDRKIFKDLYEPWVCCVSGLLCSDDRVHNQIGRNLCCELWDFTIGPLKAAFSMLTSIENIE
ncbi:unnamed protein product, partial [Hymenolepis diminuta]